MLFLSLWDASPRKKARRDSSDVLSVHFFPPFPRLTASGNHSSLLPSKKGSHREVFFLPFVDQVTFKRKAEPIPFQLLLTSLPQLFPFALSLSLTPSPFSLSLTLTMFSAFLLPLVALASIASGQHRFKLSLNLALPYLFPSLPSQADLSTSFSGLISSSPADDQHPWIGSSVPAYALDCSSWISLGSRC